MARRKLISSKEAATLLGIATDEDSLIRHIKEPLVYRSPSHFEFRQAQQGNDQAVIFR